MIRDDRELLAELARVNSDAAPLAMRIMDASATADEQQMFAERLIQLGERFKRRAEQQAIPVVQGEVVANVDLRDESCTGAPTASREQRVGDDVPAAGGAAAAAAGRTGRPRADAGPR